MSFSYFCYSADKMVMLHLLLSIPDDATFIAFASVNKFMRTHLNNELLWINRIKKYYSQCNRLPRSNLTYRQYYPIVSLYEKIQNPYWEYKFAQYAMKFPNYALECPFHLLSYPVQEMVAQYWLENNWDVTYVQKFKQPNYIWSYKYGSLNHLLCLGENTHTHLILKRPLSLQKAYVDQYMQKYNFPVDLMMEDIIHGQGLLAEQYIPYLSPELLMRHIHAQICEHGCLTSGIMNIVEFMLLNEMSPAFYLLLPTNALLTEMIHDMGFLSLDDIVWYLQSMQDTVIAILNIFAEHKLYPSESDWNDLCDYVDRTPYDSISPKSQLNFCQVNKRRYSQMFADLEIFMKKQKGAEPMNECQIHKKKYLEVYEQLSVLIQEDLKKKK